jgi:NADH:ubiquinone oxidoreductase subunit D
MAGARKGEPRSLLRALARALPVRLDIFVVPGSDVARALGLDLRLEGVRTVATPRHANVLLVVGELPEPLLAAATVVYAQMPRPRAVVALGAGDISPLPPADAVGSVTQEGLEGALTLARQLLRAAAWSAEAVPFEAEGLAPKRRKAKKRSPDQGIGAGQAGGGMGGGGMGGGGMEMGFMSMVRLTQHLPRSPDGLPMERVQAPFGPFFPGLPSGLGLTLWLDGDSVARVEVDRSMASRVSARALAGDREGLPGRLERLDPLAPSSYRLLAELALQVGPDERPGERPGETSLQRVTALERERIASHLNWLASFGYLLGHLRLSWQAAEWQQAVRRTVDAAQIVSRSAALLRFVDRVRRIPLLSSRLRGIGALAAGELQGVSGPIARASGLELDARLGDPVYRSLAFEPVLRREGDALARLMVRLEEIRASLALLAAVESPGRPAAPIVSSKAPRASVETPRGTARLGLVQDASSVAEVALETPSRRALELIERVAVGLELSDALVAIASLDISPWEAAA